MPQPMYGPLKIQLHVGSGTVFNRGKDLKTWCLRAILTDFSNTDLWFPFHAVPKGSLALRRSTLDGILG